MDNDTFEKNVISKIYDGQMNQEDFEILLYSFRFIFKILTCQNNSFYKNMILRDTNNILDNNFIPGNFPYLNEYIKSYNNLVEFFTNPQYIGYYICKDCGFLYQVQNCTLPMETSTCPNGHTIGGRGHNCSKLDIRVFPDAQAKNNFLNNNSNRTFLPQTLEEFKKNYVNKNINFKEKGIMKGYRKIDFISDKYLTNINNITYRILNFILYSCLLASYILGNISKKDLNLYLIEDLAQNNIFSVIKEGWKLLNNNLKNVGIENSKVFFNIIFDELIEYIINLNMVDTRNKLDEFEINVNDFILEKITTNNAKKINEEYQRLNGELLNLNPNNIKEVILSSYEPTLYSKEAYPDIQYYCTSDLNNLDTFTNIFNSSNENKRKYSLINILVNKNLDFTKNIIKMKNLININKLSNLLIKIYSYKISREDAKKRKLKNEIKNIIEIYNEASNKKINDKEFIREFVEPFLESWNNIKSDSVQYMCRQLRNIERGEKPLSLTIDNYLCYFLIDDGDKDGGMFLASAYENFIQWQNQFIDDIIDKNNLGGILNSYISQLEIEINIQDAEENEIINIDDNTYYYLEELISSCSIRNIFDINGKQIYYKNYNDIKYDYDIIEEKLAKLILPGLKKFKKNKYKFITYLYEGFRGQNSTVLTQYNEKYEQHELTEDEKNYINKSLKNINDDNKVYNDIFSSLQILMNEILKENYQQNYLLYDIIQNIPKYVILNDELIKLIENRYNKSKFSFTINSLVSIFEYFEELCWESIKKYIPEDFKTPIDSKIIKNIRNYFGKIKDDKKKLINKIIFTKAIRKLISRYIVGTRQETDIKPEIELKLHIIKPEFWPKYIIDDNDAFNLQIDEIFNSKINVEQSLELYNSLQGDENQFKKTSIVYKKEEEEKEEKKINNQNKIDDLISLKSINSEIINESMNKNNIEEDINTGKENNDKKKSKILNINKIISSKKDNKNHGMIKSNDSSDINSNNNSEYNHSKNISQLYKENSNSNSENRYLTSSKGKGKEEKKIEKKGRICEWLYEKCQVF